MRWFFGLAFAGFGVSSGLLYFLTIAAPPSSGESNASGATIFLGLPRLVLGVSTSDDNDVFFDFRGIAAPLHGGEGKMGDDLSAHSRRLVRTFLTVAKNNAFWRTFRVREKKQLQRF